MDDSFIQLRVIYEDLPDLIELAIKVRYGGWSADSRAYASPTDFAEEAKRLAKWASDPDHPMTLECGADTGLGWLVMRFYTVDLAGHICCAVNLATPSMQTWHAQHRGARPESTWRFGIEMPTEAGLLERFALECLALSTDFSRTARLVGVP